jgi:bacillithiol system protein YtxJ
MREITTSEALDRLLAESAERPIFLYKHSPACPISAAVLHRINEYLDHRPAECPEFYLVNVLQSHQVSTDVALRLGVRHESPQLILVKSGEALWSVSHRSIGADAINGALAEHLAAR